MNPPLTHRPSRKTDDGGWFAWFGALFGAGDAQSKPAGASGAGPASAPADAGGDSGSDGADGGSGGDGGGGGD
jgi:hypothetical protein